MQITYDRYALKIDGERVFIRSGAMHYFRLPSQAMWHDRLFKLKAAGYNTVDLYFCWNYHSPAPGVYDFTGMRDVDALLKITRDLGLFVIARPGPYINAEYSGGGFPGWLLAQRHIPLRNRREGAFVWSDAYMAAVKEWWQQIIPRINASDNVLMVQIENEYGTLDVEPDYMQALYTLTRDLGVKVPLFHNDLYVAGLYEDIVDLYAFDNYSVTQFDTDWREMPEIFQVIDNIDTTLRPFCQNRPLFVAELQAGWFATWKGYSYETITRFLDREHIGIVTKSLLGKGLTLFNHYKAIGGTNWGYTGSIETYTSYDFAAPIAEVGLNTIRLYEAKAINLFLMHFDLTATDETTLAEARIDLADDSVFYSIRKNTTNSQHHWLFLRNLTTLPKTTTISGTQEGSDNLSVTVNPFEVLILPVNITLKNGFTVVLATTELLYQDSHCLVVKGNRDATVVLKDYDQRMHTIAVDALAPQGYQQKMAGGLSVIILGQHWVDTAWLEQGQRFVFGPQLMLPDNTYGAYPDNNNYLTLNCNSTHPACLHDYPVQLAPLDPIRLRLHHWQFFDEAPELKPDYPVKHSAFQPIEKPHRNFESDFNFFDFDRLGYYEGDGWYTIMPESPVKTLTLKARHVWAVFVNGVLMGHGSHLALIPGLPDPDSITIDLSKAPWQTADSKTSNQIQIFVSGLGHPKGFHDDAQTPQGLISCQLDGVDLDPALVPVYSRHRVFHQSADFTALSENYGIALAADQTSPIVRLAVPFSLPESQTQEAPWGVQLPSDCDFERLDIYLNNQLIGRYWDACKQQDCFYLPSGLLQESGPNGLSIVLMQFKKPLTLADSQAIASKIKIFPYQTITKYDL
ncbi:MAG: beta-galactosidase [Cyanobacteria bacterium P01_H01_bin.74]